MIADKLFYNGKIYSMRSEAECYQAMAVYATKIIATGTNRDILAIKAKKKVDLKGKSVFPGFIDTHEHLLAYAKLSLQATVQLDGCRSIDDIQESIYERASSISPGEWIIGRGFNNEHFVNKKLPTKVDLDKAAENNPVLITRYCGHIGVVNDLALKLAHLSAITDGIIYRAETINAITKHIPEADEKTLKEILARACQEHAAFGLTGVHTVGIGNDGQEYIGLYQELEAENRLPLCINISSDRYLDLDIHTGFGNDKIKIGYHKFFTDGSLGSRTAAMFEDYSDATGNRGELSHCQGELNTLCQKAAEHGMQLGVHAIGDRAVEEALQAFSYINSLHLQKDPRFRLIHATCCNEKLLARMKELPIIIDIQPAFLASDMDWLEKRLGEKRLPWVYPWHTYLQNNLIVTAGSDSPVESFNPIWGIFCLVNRTNVDGYPKDGFNPKERISVYQAISMYTKNAAYTAFEENKKGILTVGKLADFVVLSANPYMVNPLVLKDIVVEKTYLGGKLVYKLHN